MRTRQKQRNATHADPWSLKQQHKNIEEILGKTHQLI